MNCKRHFTKMVFIWATVFVVFIGCQSDSINSPVVQQTSVQQEITNQPAGLLGGLIGLINRLLGVVVGVITPQNGGAVHLLTSDFVIPPNAVSSSVNVTWAISEATPSGLNGGLRRLHDFGPEGLQFQVSAKLYVSYEDAGLGTNNPNLYRCYYYNTTEARWESQQTVVDATNRRFIVTINHFSRYAFGR